MRLEWYPRGHSRLPNVQDNLPNLADDLTTLPIIPQAMTKPIVEGRGLDANLDFLSAFGARFLVVAEQQKTVPNVDLARVFQLSAPHFPTDLEAADLNSV